MLLSMDGFSLKIDTGLVNRRLCLIVSLYDQFLAGYATGPAVCRHLQNPAVHCGPQSLVV